MAFNEASIATLRAADTCASGCGTAGGHKKRSLRLSGLSAWLTTSLDECRRRDEKGLYAHLSGGQVHDLPGEDLVYEAPEFPEIRARGGEDDEALQQILRSLKSPAFSPQV